MLVLVGGMPKRRAAGLLFEARRAARPAAGAGAARSAQPFWGGIMKRQSDSWPNTLTSVLISAVVAIVFVAALVAAMALSH
jgi:hypothetical protein